MVELIITPEFQKPKFECRTVEAMFGKAHPFECATTSFHEFAKHMATLPKLPDGELRQVVDRMFDLMDDLLACCSCYAKAAAFGELIAGRRLPEDAKKFGELLDERVAAAELEKPGSTGGRDFREEVLDVIGMYVPDFDAGQSKVKECESSDAGRQE